MRPTVTGPDLVLLGTLLKNGPYDHSWTLVWTLDYLLERSFIDLPNDISKKNILDVSGPKNHK